MIELRVVGVPAPQGTKTAMMIGGRARVIEGSSTTGRARHKSWREGVSTATRDWMREHPQPPLSEPVAMWIEFKFAVPASDRYRTLHSTKPDIDKIVRSTLDALVDGGLLKDDSLVWSICATKKYAHGDETTGAVITIVPSGAGEAENRRQLKLAAAEARRRPVLESPLF